MNPFHLKPCIYWWPSKLLRLRYRWTLIYVFISASLVILFCVHRGHQEQLIEYRAKSLLFVADETSPTVISTADVKQKHRRSSPLAARQLIAEVLTKTSLAIPFTGTTSTSRIFTANI